MIFQLRIRIVDNATALIWTNTDSSSQDSYHEVQYFLFVFSSKEYFVKIFSGESYSEKEIFVFSVFSDNTMSLFAL